MGPKNHKKWPKKSIFGGPGRPLENPKKGLFCGRQPIGVFWGFCENLIPERLFLQSRVFGHFWAFLGIFGHFCPSQKIIDKNVKNTLFWGFGGPKKSFLGPIKSRPVLTPRAVTLGGLWGCQKPYRLPTTNFPSKISWDE